MVSASEEVDASSPEVMLAYYKRLYPFKSVFNWLNHGPTPSKLFTHREFAFTLAGDVYLRYNSFSSADELKKQVCSLNPTRFEIGPVYSARPRDKKTVRPSAFSPQQRELVFDIDMTDYDSVRTCCSGADICRRCWAFISAAVKVLDEGVRDQFGFGMLLWVYSGRRGIHLWVSDPEALALTDEQRKAIVGWLSVIQGGKEMHKKVNVRIGTKAMPPSLQAVVGPLSDVFSDLILVDQECFASEEGWEELLHLIPDRSVVDALRKKWQREPERSSYDKWDDVKKHAKSYESKSAERNTMVAAMEDIILQYTYPRLDAEVSKHRNHLLKAPFCIHPKTSRVCVPVDPDHIDDFNPESVPTVGQLLREIDQAVARRKAEAKGQDTEMDADGADADTKADWEHTSLQPYIQMLDRHAATLMNQARLAKRAAGPDMTW